MTLGKVNYKAYVYEEDYWGDYLNRNLLVTNLPAQIATYDNAVILPLKTIGNRSYGGVISDQGEFLAGKTRSYNTIFSDPECVLDAYIPDEEEIEYINESVVFGGVIRNHFGHMLCEGLSRIWGAINEKNKNLRVAFVLHKYHPTRRFFLEILDACGITEDRRLIIDHPTRFKEVFIPEETQFLEGNYGYRSEIKNVIRCIKDNAKSKQDSAVMPKKIYLSRTQFEITNCIGEEYFENFFKCNGFEVVYPELLPFEKQVRLFSNAEIVAGTNGSILLSSMFMKDDAKLIVINRSRYRVQPVGYSISNVKAYIIDCHRNFLPETHINNCIYYLYPTSKWNQFLNENSSELKLDTASINKTKANIEDYIRAWSTDCQIKDKLRHLSWVRNESIVDLVKRILLFYSELPNSKVQELTKDAKTITQSKLTDAQMHKNCRPRISDAYWADDNLTLSGLLEKKYCGKQGFNCSIVFSTSEFSNQLNENDIELPIHKTNYSKERRGLEYEITLQLRNVLNNYDECKLFIKFLCKFKETEVLYSLGNNMNQKALDSIRQHCLTDSGFKIVIDKNINGNLAIIKTKVSELLNEMPLSSEIKKICRPRISKVEWVNNKLIIRGILEKKHCSKPGFKCYIVLSSNKYSQELQDNDIIIPITNAKYNKEDKGLNYCAILSFSEMDLHAERFFVKFGCAYNGYSVAYPFGNNISEDARDQLKLRKVTCEKKLYIGLNQCEMIEISKKVKFTMLLKNFAINI